LDFSAFGFYPELLDGIADLNFTTATPIQEQAIPIILEGKDLIGIAQTGTGKTAAFILPVIQKILESNESHYTQALVVVPTRELAVQIDQAIGAYAYFAGISSIAIYGGGGGKDFAQGKEAITGGTDIIIATPGRLLAHMNLGYVNFSRLRFLVLDEADRMLDMGFMPDLNKIIKALNPNRQNLLFSATMPQGVMRLARALMRNPVTISIALSKPAEGVSQGAYLVHDRQKEALIAEILRDRSGQRILIFCSSKISVSKLFHHLKKKGFGVNQISSDLEQSDREQVMLAFRNRQVDILVATDVLSRGIDIDGIDLVINYDVPRDAEDYVHRIGRTARAARKGAALTLVSHADMGRFKRIEKLIGNEVPKMPVPAHLEIPREQDRPRPKPAKNKAAGARKHEPASAPDSAPAKKRRRGGRNRKKKAAGNE
jgi:superfamily II DNA/RNA helicase